MAPALAMAALMAVAVEAQPALLRVRVVDALTGVGVPARVSVSCCLDRQLVVETAPEGGPIRLSPAEHRVRVEAAGYRPLTTRLELSPGADLPVTFELDALARADAPSRELPVAGTVVLHGYVIDAVTLRPIAAARVALPDGGPATTTGDDGYFRLALAEPAGDEGRPPLTTLLINAPGYAPHRVTGLVLAPGATVLREMLSPGEEPTTRDDTPRALRTSDEAGALRAVEGPAPTAAPRGTLVALDPPASIRVGTSCTCSTCAAVSVLSLETYVKRGLNDEWIASWNGHSLRAGAVAYRAYGTWYTQHPISGTYDICSTTCCQVNDTDTSSSTDAAVDRTAGYLLERGAAVFRAEYSAENNGWDDPGDGLSCSNADLSCGDGSAGSPAAGWSCLADGVDATHGCFGHGRGACQWGTQRWSLQGRRWNWILDHYYNDHGAGTGQRTAHLSSPLVLLQAQAPPRVGRGATFTLTARASNRAALPHAHVLLGASLQKRGQVVSDPAHDAPLALPPGDSDVARAFEVRLTVDAGTYDLLVSLYDDVDEDGAITNGIDLPLQLLVRPGAVEVCPSPFCPVRPGR